MPRLLLEGSWFVNAPREKLYEIMSDFESMPKNFPTVAKSVSILSREGNNLTIDAVAPFLGVNLTAHMQTELIPPKGYISHNNSPITKDGVEKFLMEEENGGTRITYTYDIEVRNPLLRVIAKPLIGGFMMWHWKRAVIDRLEVLASQ
ncbi:SRPBCC family protein [candidate division WWE3 bacterium]|uniref:SRPBCC family protein n=1 Tax=candidate division WWE3 bacterium TaxID=2053526 RepID=A0A955LH73_UNCKA|nr:SRPBCC family protein [candidate division WWE3 bacterium]